jgi:O-antigen/teichoic acid export membrane protein
LAFACDRFVKHIKTCLGSNGYASAKEVSFSAHRTFRHSYPGLLKGALAASSMIEYILQLLRRDVTRGVAGTILLKVGSGGLAFAMFSLAARTMSPDAFGLFATWLCIAQIASVIGLVGQELVLVRFLNEYHATGAKDLAKGVLVFCMGVAAAATVAAAAMIAAAGGVKGESALLVLAVVAFMAVNSGLMLGSQIARSLVSILMGEGNREFFWRIIVVTFLLVLLFGHHQISPTEMFTLMAAAMLIGLAVQAFSIARALPAVHATTARYETRRWTASGGRFWLSSILDAANQYFDVILIYWLLDGVTAGIYFAASRLANIFGMLSAALYTFAARRLPLLYFSKNHEEFEHTIVLMAEVTALCVLSGLVVVCVGAPYLLGLFGPAFVAQKWTLIVLAIGTAFQAAGGPASAIIQLTGRESSYVPVVAANVLLRLAGFFILIPWLGVLGAAVAATLSLGVTTIALNVICRRWTGVDPSVLVLFKRSRWKAKARPAAAADPSV